MASATASRPHKHSDPISVSVVKVIQYFLANLTDKSNSANCKQNVTRFLIILTFLEWLQDCIRNRRECYN
jgi:hypothetical protein